jgi:hypothetical protein
MFVLLRCTCCLARIVKHERFSIEHLHCDQRGLKVIHIQNLALLFHFFSDDQNVVSSQRELVENESMSWRESFIDADAWLKWLQENITFPKGFRLLLRLRGVPVLDQLLDLAWNGFRVWFQGLGAVSVDICQ